MRAALAMLPNHERELPKCESLNSKLIWHFICRTKNIGNSDFKTFNMYLIKEVLAMIMLSTFETTDENNDILLLWIIYKNLTAAPKVFWNCDLKILSSLGCF